MLRCERQRNNAAAALELNPAAVATVLVLYAAIIIYLQEEDEFNIELH